MELEKWVKTLFSIYNCLENMAGAIDKYIEIKSLNCMNISIETATSRNAMQVFDDITNLTNKKITLINIKVIVEKVLEILPQRESRYMIMRYVENQSYFEIAEHMDVSLRTIQRLNENLIQYSCKVLRNINYDENKLFNLCKNEDWLINIVFNIDTINLYKMKKLLVLKNFIKTHNTTQNMLLC